MLEENLLCGGFYLFALFWFGFLVCFLFVLHVLLKCSDYRFGLLPVCETLIRYLVP